MFNENAKMISRKINVKVNRCANDIIRYLLEKDVSFNAVYSINGESTISYVDMPEERDRVIFKEIEKNFLCRSYTLQ